MKTLEKSLTLLELAAAAPDGVGVRDLARQSGMNTTTVHGILATFARNGYLDAEGGTYRLGLKAFLLGANGNGHDALWNHCRPHLEKLMDQTGHTTACTVRQGSRIVSLGVCSPQTGVAVMMQPGPVEHAHTTATGKYLLAMLPEHTIIDYIKIHPLKKVTEKSITLRTDLLREFEDIRNNDMALTVEESLPGVSALATGVRNKNGMILASVGITFPAAAAEDVSARNKLAAQLMQCARHIEDGLR